MTRLPDPEGKPAIVDIFGGDPSFLVDGVPHAKALGMELVSLGKGIAELKVPYREDLIGDPARGILAGGVVTTLLDNASGAAAMAAMSKAVSVATLDLRIDYMSAAQPHKTIFGRAHCYKITRSIAFVRGVAYHDDMDDPIATSTSTFILNSDGGRKPGANTREHAE